MKKYVVLLICCMLSLSVVGCKDENANDAEATETVETTVEEEASEEDGDTSEDSEDSENLDDMFKLDSETTSGDTSVDLDLTALSATMVYSEVFAMMTAPDEYEGKTIKMSGIASKYTDENTGKVYYACIVQDATQCCSQGIEFVLSDDYGADEYPNEGDEITLKGTFDTYSEGQYVYITLLDAQLQ